LQRILEAAFNGCISTLTDSVGWNDSISLRTLAKILACVPGLELEAQIAASCQLYILDMGLHKTENAEEDSDGTVEEIDGN
jgi:hypothetical protein